MIRLMNGECKDGDTLVTPLTCLPFAYPCPVRRLVGEAVYELSLFPILIFPIQTKEVGHDGASFYTIKKRGRETYS